MTFSNTFSVIYLPFLPLLYYSPHSQLNSHLPLFVTFSHSYHLCPAIPFSKAASAHGAFPLC